jgi:hypothetical protein
VFKYRVAYVRCKDLHDKAEGIVKLIDQSTSDVSAAHVITSFLAWAEERRIPNLRFMNAVVARLVVKGDHTSTPGKHLGSNWLYNLLNEESASLGHLLTQTTKSSEFAAWLCDVGKRPGMSPVGLVLDDWLIGRDKYIEQLGRVESGKEADFSGTVWDVWKEAMPSLKWPFLDKFHVVQNFKKGIPHLNYSLPNKIFCVGARDVLGTYDTNVKSQLEKMMLEGGIVVKEFTHFGAKRSCVLGLKKEQLELDEWHADGSFWQAFGVGPTKVLGLKSRRYNAIEAKVDELFKVAKEAFFWPDESTKRFSKVGNALTLLPQNSSEEGVIIISSASALRHRFDNFKKRAIMAGRVQNIGLPEHLNIESKERHGLPCVKSIIHTGDVESRNGLQQHWVASQSGNDDLKTAIAYEASTHDQRVHFDKRMAFSSKKVKTNNWMNGIRLNAHVSQHMPACMVPVPKLAAVGTPLAALFRKYEAPFLRGAGEKNVASPLDLDHGPTTATPLTPQDEAAQPPAKRLKLSAPGLGGKALKRTLTEKQKQQAKLNVQWSRTLGSLRKCTCNLTTRTGAGGGKHHVRCEASVFAARHMAAKPIAGVELDTAAQRAILLDKPNIGDTYTYLTDVAGRDGLIMYASTVQPGRAAEPNARTTPEFIDVGNKCGIRGCGKYGKFVEDHLVQPSITTIWRQNIARIRSPTVEICTH